MIDRLPNGVDAWTIARKTGIADDPCNDVQTNITIPTGDTVCAVCNSTADRGILDITPAAS
jgi:hypothetical protein